MSQKRTEEAYMTKKQVVVISMVSVLMMVFAAPALAHLHPYVPANDCASSFKAGNTAMPMNGANGQQFIGAGVNPAANPGKAEMHNNFFATNPGVSKATANC